MKWRKQAVSHRVYAMNTLFAKTKITIFLSILLLIPAAVFANDVQPEYVPGSLIVERDETIPAKTLSTLAVFGAQVEKNTPETLAEQFIEVQLPSDDSRIMNAAIDYLLEQPGIVSVEREQIRRITATPDDTRFIQMWHLDSGVDGGVTAETAWDTQTGSDDIVVAVIDTGVDTDHPDLADNMWVNTGETPGNGIDDDGNGYVDDYYGYDFVDSDGNPNPAPDGLNNDGFAGIDTGITHGSHVAGTVAAQGNNGLGVTGVAWDTSIMAIRVLDDEGSGTDRSIADGIEYAAANGADIIHMSLGGYGSTSALQAGVETAQAADIPIIAAAGNDGVSINLNPFYPTCYDNVIGVASTSQSNAASSFSNYGDDCVDIAAPGESILSTLYTGDVTYNFVSDYGKMSGTSMAAPVVSGVAALLLAEESSLTTSQITDILTLTADDISLDEDYGSGKVNAAAAIDGVELANNPAGPTVKAWKNSKKNKEFTSGKRKKVQRPYFTWNEPSDDDGIAGYYVYFGTKANANPVTEGTLQTDRTFQPAKKISGNEKAYYLRVSAVDNLDNVSNTPGEFEYVIDTVVKRPKKFKVTRAKNGLRVQWRKVKNEHIKKYKIYRKQVFKNKKKNRKSKFKLIGSVKSKKKQYVDKKVQPGKTYRYRVRAIDNFGNKRFSKSKAKKFVPKDDVVVATASGTPLVRVYNTSTKKFGKSWQAYNASDANGVEVATGDVDGDGRAEIVTMPSQGVPQVKVFAKNGKLQSSFNAFDADTARGGRIAVGDFDGNGRAEIATLSYGSTFPMLRVYSGNGTLQSVHASMATSLGNSGYMTPVNWDGGEQDELAIAVGGSNTGHVVVYSPMTSGVLTTFNAYPEGVDSDVRLGAVSRERSVKENIATAPVNGAVQVRQFGERNGAAQQVQDDFYGFVQVYNGGGSITAGRVNGPASDYVIVGSNGERQATIQMYNSTGKTLQETLFPFGGYSGGITIATGWF